MADIPTYINAMDNTVETVCMGDACTDRSYVAGNSYREPMDKTIFVADVCSDPSAIDIADSFRQPLDVFAPSTPSGPSSPLDHSVWLSSPSELPPCPSLSEGSPSQVPSPSEPEAEEQAQFSFMPSDVASILWTPRHQPPSLVSWSEKEDETMLETASAVAQRELEEENARTWVNKFLKNHGYSGVNSKRIRPCRQFPLLRSKYPLHTAVKEKSGHVVRLLLWAGADPGLKDSFGLTPHKLAEKSNNCGSHDDVIAALVGLRTSSVAAVGGS